MTQFKLLRYIIAILLGLSFMFVLGCSLDNHSEYPLIPEESSIRRFELGTESTTQPGSSETLPESGSATKTFLRVAGPWSSSELNILGHYYGLMQSDASTMADAQLKGDQISLDWLSTYDSDIILQAVPMSIEESMTGEQERLWSAAQNWPDIILTHSLPDQAYPDSYADLKPLLIDQPELAADQVNANLIRISEGNDGWYGIPWRVTLPVLFFNRNLLKDANISEPAGSLNWETFVGVVDQLVQKYSHENRLLNASTLRKLSTPSAGGTQVNRDAVQVIANPQALLQFWPAAQTLDLRWATWDGSHFNYNSDAFAGGVDAVRGLVQNGSTLLPVDQQTLESIGSVEKLIQSGQVVFWIGNSTDIVKYGTDPALQVGYSLLPLRKSEQILRYPVELLTLSVSNSSKNQKLAAQVAAFLSADPDALLVQMRLATQEGCFPAVNDQKVWELSLSQINGGHGLEELQGQLLYAYTGGQFEVQSWDSLLEKTIGTYAERLLTSSDPQREIGLLQSQADQLTR